MRNLSVFAPGWLSNPRIRLRLSYSHYEEPKDMPHWQLHDLRRTARSLMSRASVTPHISERVLGHTIKGVEGTYDRHSYESEKGHALQALAALVGLIVNPPEGSNVVPMHA